MDEFQFLAHECAFRLPGVDVDLCDDLLQFGDGVIDESHVFVAGRGLFKQIRFKMSCALANQAINPFGVGNLVPTMSGVTVLYAVLGVVKLVTDC